MSRTIAAPRGSSTKNKSITTLYKLFIWDVGTDSRQPPETTIRTLAAVEFSSDTRKVAHFSTSIRPTNVTTPNKTTPTFPQAWKRFASFIKERSNGQTPLLVSHNAAFDVTVLLNQLQTHNIKLPSKWRFACSLLFSRSVHPFTFHNSQLALAFRLGVSVSRPHHTAEDVIVLRDILIALDQKAIHDGKPLNRVVQALCLDARKPAFFDRTPQPFSPNTKASSKFFITQTGTRYHRQACKWLGRSTIPRDTPPPGFKPCHLCRPDVKNYVIPDKHTAKNQSKTNPSTRPSSLPLTKVFVTETGNRYHVEGCRWLSKSKIPKDTPPPGLKPCGTCLKDYRPEPVRHKTKAKLSSPAVSHKKSSKTAPLYISETGSKYHLDGCKSLAQSRIPKNTPPSGYEPCGVCLPNVAYNGSPQLKMIPA